MASKIRRLKTAVAPPPADQPLEEVGLDEFVEQGVVPKQEQEPKEELVLPTASAPAPASASGRKLKKPKSSAPKPVLLQNYDPANLTTKAYRPSTSPEILQDFQERSKLVSAQETRVGDAKKALREAVKAYQAEPSLITLSDVIEANSAVRAEDCGLSRYAKNPKAFFTYNGLLQRDLNFDNYRQNKTAEEVGSVKYNTFPVEFFFRETVVTEPTARRAVLPNPDVEAEGAQEAQELNQKGGTIRNYTSRQIGAIIGAKKAYSNA